MNLEDLRYFAEAARKCNFTQAARALAITPSALSHSIKRLEDQLNGKLFTKVGRQLQLTTEGLNLAKRAEQVLDNIASIRSEFGGRPGLPPLVRVGIAVAETATSFIEAWSGLTGLDDLKLQISTMRSSQVVQQVAKRELELGLSLNPLPYPEVRIETIATTDSVITVKKDHPLTELSERQQLKMLPAYRLAGTTHLPAVGPCQSHPIFAAMESEQKPTLVYDNFAVAEAMLIHCDAWSIMPRAVVERSATLAIILPKFQGSIELALLQHEEVHYGEALDELTAALRNRFRNAGWN